MLAKIKRVTLPEVCEKAFFFPSSHSHTVSRVIKFIYSRLLIDNKLLVDCL